MFADLQVNIWQYNSLDSVWKGLYQPCTSDQPILCLLKLQILILVCVLLSAAAGFPQDFCVVRSIYFPSAFTNLPRPPLFLMLPHSISFNVQKDQFLSYQNIDPLFHRGLLENTSQQVSSLLAASSLLLYFNVATGKVTEQQFVCTVSPTEGMGVSFNQCLKRH